MYINAKNQIIILFSLLAVLLLNWYFFHNQILGIIIGIFYLIWLGYLLGYKIFPEKDNLWRFWWGVFLLESLITVIGATIYFVYRLSEPLPLVILSLIALVITFIKPKTIQLFFHNRPNIRPITVIFALLYIILAISSFSMLFKGVTLEPVRGPWDIIGSKYLCLFFAATLVWLLLLIQSKSNLLAIGASIIHFMLSSTVALIVFPLGFGFDSFLHQAAEKIILTDGVILPKTVYYLGQYSLVIHHHYLTLIPIDLIDKMLLPITFSLFIPPLLWLTFNNILKIPIQSLGIIAAFFLLMPFAQFIQTTPQGLANLFIIISIGWYFIYRQEKTRRELLVLLLLIAVTLSIHPLAGIPLILWLLAIFAFFKIRKAGQPESVKKIIWMTIIILLSFAVPAAFYISGIFGGNLGAHLTLPSLTELSFTNLWHIESFNYTKQYQSIFDFIYLYRFNWLVLFFAVAFAGWFIHKKRRLILGGDTLILGFGLVWLNSAFLNIFFRFDNLIAYEQEDFSSRLFTIVLLFLLPFFLVALLEFWQKIKTNVYSRIFFIVLISGVVTASVYISYPRYDAYELVRTFNTSRYDIEAVQLIENGTPDAYVVLANQAASAAAIKELGFKDYYQGHFFYPLPTGGQLYQIYLDMVYKEPSRENAKKAAEFTRINTIYFVLNDYWHNSETIKKAAIKEANSFQEIGGGKITIFKYQF